MAEQLLYVISDIVHTIARGTTRKGGAQTLIVIEEEQTTLVERRNRIVQRIIWPRPLEKLMELVDKHSPKRAILLGHANIFPNEWDEKVPLRIVREADAQVADELGKRRKTGTTVTLSAFHHVDDGIHTLFGSKNSLDDADEFFDRVTAKLEDEQKSTAFERLSVLKHDLLKLFNALNVRLQVRDDDGDGAAVQIGDEFAEKLRGARDIVQRVEETTRSQGGNGIDELRRLLATDRATAATADARLFATWLGELSDAIDAVRSREQTR